MVSLIETILVKDPENTIQLTEVFDWSDLLQSARGSKLASPLIKQ